MSCDDLNYANDERVTASDRRWWTSISKDRRHAIALVYDAESGDDCDAEGDGEIEVAIDWEVCPLCRGKGTHVNPSIDCNGLTSEGFAEDPDFREEYFSGMYDQECNLCRGERVVPVAHGPKARQLIQARLDRLDDLRRERANELRYGY